MLLLLLLGVVAVGWSCICGWLRELVTDVTGGPTKRWRRAAPWEHKHTLPLHEPTHLDDLVGVEIA